MLYIGVIHMVETQQLVWVPSLNVWQTQWISTINDSPIPANTSRQTNIITANYTINSYAAHDYVILCNAIIPITVNLPASPNVGDTYYVKDKSGNALANNVTVNGNGKNIDGNTHYTLNRNYESASFIFDGVNWNLL